MPGHCWTSGSGLQEPPPTPLGGAGPPTQSQVSTNQTSPPVTEATSSSPTEEMMSQYMRNQIQRRKVLLGQDQSSPHIPTSEERNGLRGIGSGSSKGSGSQRPSGSTMGGTTSTKGGPSQQTPTGQAPLGGPGAAAPAGTGAAAGTRAPSSGASGAERPDREVRVGSHSVHTTGLAEGSISANTARPGNPDF